VKDTVEDGEVNG